MYLCESEGVTWSGNRYAKRPPTVRFSTDGDVLYFTEYVDETLRTL